MGILQPGGTTASRPPATATVNRIRSANPSSAGTVYRSTTYPSTSDTYLQSPSGSSIGLKVRGMLTPTARGVGFGNPANKTYTPGPEVAESYAARNYREYMQRDMIENPEKYGINQPKPSRGAAPARQVAPTPAQVSPPAPATPTLPAADPSGFRPYQNRPAPRLSNPPTLPRTRPVTPPASSIQPRIPNSVANARIPSGIRSTVGGLAPSAASVAKDFIDNQFDRRFPELAPLRRAADLANPITASKSIAEHPLNPLNPFGRLWDWAPWNDKKSPSNLNPGPVKPVPNIDPNGFWPVDNPPDVPISFSVELKSQAVFQSHTGNISVMGSQDFYAIGVGIPLGWELKPTELFGQITYTFLAKNAAGEIFGLLRRTLNTQAPPLPTPGGYNRDIVPIYTPATGNSGMEQRMEPIQFPVSPIEIFPPLPSPQFEPIADPAYPRFPRPDTHPSQTPRPAPPSTAPRPSPIPQTQPQTQPQPQPQTQPQPPAQPLPGQAPFPNAIPNPAPRPSNAPNPNMRQWINRRNREEEGVTQNPQFGDMPWKAPEIVRMNSPLIPKPAPQVQPDPTTKDLQEQIKKVGEGIEEGTRRGCQYREDDFAVANVTQMTGINPITNEPQFTVVPMPVHEKLKDYIEWQSQSLSKIQGQADGLRGRLKRIADRLQIVRFLTIMGNVASIHNALMLSRDISSSLGDLASVLLTKLGQVGGVLGENDAIDVNEQLGKVFNAFMEETIGQDLWKGTKRSWLLVNQIVMSASSIVYNIRSAADAARSIAEFTANNIGFIGNALKKWGVVSENAYPWMSTNVTSRTAFQAKMDNIRQGLEQFDETVGTVHSVVNDGVEINDSFNEAGRNFSEMQKSIKEGVSIVYPDNEPNKNAASQSKTLSQGKDIDSVEFAINGEEP